jgi:3-hydroxybutyryl-CoA dehydrogenase
MMRPGSGVAVIGAGTMGHGIAYAAAVGGHATVLTDASSQSLSSARSRIDSLFARATEKGKLDQNAVQQARELLRFEPDLDTAVHGQGVVIEAVPEQLDMKQELLKHIEPLVSAGSILATNTSALSISAIASSLSRPERFVGLHFFNPVPAMKLVEIVRGNATSDAVIQWALGFADSLGKTPIVVRDSPGFATSRLGVVLGLEAMRMVEQGVASAEDIDRAMELGYNHPVGPLKLTDLVGLDVRLAIAEHLYATFGDDTYRPPEILRTMVAEGRLGKKSGRGFHEWKD